jgi:adenylate cyclase
MGNVDQVHLLHRCALPSAWRILNGEIGKDEIEGRILLIGTSAAGLLTASHAASPVPGVELHAQAIEQVLQANICSGPISPPAELIYILALGMIIAVLIYRAGALAALCLGAAIAAVVESPGTPSSFGWLIRSTRHRTSAVYLAGTLFVSRTERSAIGSAMLSHYWRPPCRASRRRPGKAETRRQARDMTLLFSDVRGFTTISESLDAEELTRFLNSLFTPLSNIILEEQGTIDKFMGDAVMAFWNAPLEDSAHPTHACNAALRIMSEMERLNEHWREEAEAKGRKFKPVRIGIGLNTGICCVGNLGSETRFDYSVIGDNVNVASRLEGQSKTYDVGTVVGESTTARAPDFAFLELDLLKVKGKTEATRVFALLGDSAVRQSPDFIRLAERHGEFLARYRAKDWDAAEALSHECEKTNTARLDTLYALYRERIAYFRMNPPPPNWDGAAEALSK